jgi:hypothetical protein
MSQIREGEARSCSACRSGCVYQVRSRPSSSPARLEQKTVSPIRCCGVAWATTWSSMPASRSTSIVRWFVMCARGVSESRPYLVTTMLATPYVLSSSAAAPPAGPLPTTSTSVSTSVDIGDS